MISLASSLLSRNRKIRQKLLLWYDRNRRDLPWRRTRSPYRIWIAETLLQQTQVKTVLPYYLRLLRAFPSLRKLDRAPMEKVLALWSGLGYYRRAVNLKRAARMIMRRHHGKIPRTFSALCALPGIGNYTAGALMSIAFNQPYPAMDGNARRVLRRLFSVRGDNALGRLAANLVSRSRPGDFNQALMDLGATICLPINPTCSSCPCRRLCTARLSGSHAAADVSVKTTSHNLVWPLGLVISGDRLLLHRRSQTGLLARLWEVPGGTKEGDETPKQALRRHLEGRSDIVAKARYAGEVLHSITRYRIRAPVFLSSAAGDLRLSGAAWRWVPLSSIKRYPLSSLSLKAIRLLPGNLQPSKGDIDGRDVAAQ